MADISIIELFFYGFVELASFTMLLIGIVKEVPNSKLESIARSIFIVPGVICAGILASSGVNIQTHIAVTNDIIKNLNDSSTWQDISNNTQNIVLQNPVWIAFHFLLFSAMLFYILWQAINLLHKKD